MNQKIYYLLLLIIAFLCLSCNKRHKTVDLIGLNPVEYNKDQGLRHLRISILYSKDNPNQDLFDIICKKLTNEYSKDKEFKIGELYTPLETSRLYYANKETSSIFDTENIGQPLSLFQIEANDCLSIVKVYKFRNHVGIHIASGS